MKWTKVTAGHYVTADFIYETRRHDWLTWQDAPYWTLSINSRYVTWEPGQTRARRFRTLADVKAYAWEQESKAVGWSA
jgi:hypothetical protein